MRKVVFPTCGRSGGSSGSGSGDTTRLLYLAVPVAGRARENHIIYKQPTIDFSAIEQQWKNEHFQPGEAGTSLNQPEAVVMSTIAILRRILSQLLFTRVQHLPGPRCLCIIQNVHNSNFIDRAMNARARTIITIINARTTPASRASPRRPPS